MSVLYRDFGDGGRPGDLCARVRVLGCQDARRAGWLCVDPKGREVRQGKRRYSKGKDKEGKGEERNEGWVLGGQ